MITERVYKGIRYTLSNENLEVGDKVYPIAWGRTLPNGDFIFHNYDYRKVVSGFPDEPHTILKFKTDCKPIEVRTDHGYSPKEVYYKIVKKEKQEMAEKYGIKNYEWKEIL